MADVELYAFVKDYMRDEGNDMKVYRLVADLQRKVAVDGSRVKMCIV